MYPDTNLEMLMARYQEGDFAAATALIDRISPQLYRFFVGQFASRPDADDLLQETPEDSPRAAYLPAGGAGVTVVLCDRLSSKRSLAFLTN